MKYLITGGCGFIGSRLVRMALADGHEVVNLDKLTYAGNRANLAEVEADPRYRLVEGDIADPAAVEPLVAEADLVINVAAETHVDRSIDAPGAFLETNVWGVYTICEAVRVSKRPIRLLQVSTDEVYGSIDQGAFREEDPLKPSSPYSASKAAGELLAFSYHTTWGLDVVATRGANTYGPYQYPEKLIPYFVTELIEGRNVPLYGDGGNVRDWLFVDDHARAILTVAAKGKPGESYNVSGENERTNIFVTNKILELMSCGDDRIERVADRPGHDRRYAVEGSKLAELGHRRSVDFEDGLERTVRWYRDHEAWWHPLKEASKAFFERHYASLKK